jgi:predicted TIM-barrel fold metal-dependent hydrolase
MNIAELIAIDVHTHAEVSCHQPFDESGKEFDDAKVKYFKSGKLPTIAETIAYYRSRKIGLVMFSVDSEFEMGRRRIPNKEVAEAAAENSDIMIAFASVDPHKGKLGVREMRRLLADHGVKGFKFHPTRLSPPSIFSRASRIHGFCPSALSARRLQNYYRLFGGASPLREAPQASNSFFLESANAKYI